MNNTQGNDNTRENKKGTVSIRNMTLGIWYAAGYECKKKGITLKDYIENLIKKDLQLGENIGDTE